jgi:hypothetical protein
VKAVAANGDHERAAQLAGEAEALTAQITYWKKERPWLVEAVAASGDHERAEALTAQITDPYSRAEALTRLVEAVVASGDHERAARLATQAVTATGQIIVADLRTEALAQVARTLVRKNKETLPVSDHLRGRPLTVQAHHLLAEALVTGPWAYVIFGLARVDSLAVTALADDVQARWRLNAPGFDRDSEPLTVPHEAYGSRRVLQWMRGLLRRGWGGG